MLTIHDCQLELFVNPLGDVNVQLSIRSSFDSSDILSVGVELGGYIFEYQEFRGMTWPFGKKVREIENELVSCSINNTSMDQDASIDELRDGSNRITIPVVDFNSIEEFTLEYKIKNLMNRDILYNEVVIPIWPLIIENTDREYSRISYRDMLIEGSFGFAWGARSYSATLRKFSLESTDIEHRWDTRGKVIDEKDTRNLLLSFHTNSDTIEKLQNKREGDTFSIQWEGDLRKNEQLDLHVRGANIPYATRVSRGVFWSVLWVVLLLLLFITSIASISVSPP